ncbi:PREDICTED: WSC domain-containing protein 2, partial [Tinamus guttatus]|uniref:WSC domain-containing protein 2 n=1 Tax=Tinamus guttatus TaxID=94827 RepID=UPI00052EA343
TSAPGLVGFILPPRSRNSWQEVPIPAPQCVRSRVDPALLRTTRYVGCYEDSPRRRTLRGVSFFDYKKMTVFRCQDNCAERGYLYAGLEFGAECYCGHKIQAGNVSEAECAMACKGFKGERDHWRSGRTICVKTHESGQKEIESFDAAILLIRNPYKALMAEFNRKYGGHIGFAAHAHWQGKEWPEFVRTYAPWWAAHTLDWLRFGRNVLVVHFEDLKRDLFAQLQRMVGLLGIAAREDRLLCVEGQKDGNFKRSGLRKLEYDPYTPEMRALIGSYIKSVDAALRLRNLSGVPDDYSPR